MQTLKNSFFVSCKCPLILALLLVFAFQFGHGQAFRPEFKVKKKSLFRIAKNQEHTFGYLKVLEDRNKPEGGTIQLPVYWFKCRGEQPRKDPILFLIGGPGNSIMRNARYMQYYTYLNERDVILFEQRGTRYAKPHLGCPEWAEAGQKAMDPALTGAEIDALYLEAARRCKDRYQRKGIDLDSYRTTAIAADVEDLRRALGIEKWNLLTLSYGTKIAQVLMRDYPEGIRSVVMDSPLPLEANWDEESVRNTVEGLQRLCEICAADSACNQAYPELWQKFLAFLRDANREPIQLAVAHPKTKKEMVFRLTGKDLIGVYAGQPSAGIPSVPGQMWKLINGDYEYLQASVKNLLGGKGNASGQGMRISVWCAEEAPFTSKEGIRQAADDFDIVEGMESYTVAPSICDFWRVKPAQAIENEPVISDIPTLLISGGLDPITPTIWARKMQENLSRCQLVVFDRWMHGPLVYWSKPCAMEVARTFFEDPYAAPQVPCVEEMNAIPFEVE